VGIPEDRTPETAVESMVRLAMRSVAKVAIIPFQDILKKGTTARMNTPSEASGNWQWRATEEEIAQKQDWLLETTWLTGRKV